MGRVLKCYPPRGVPNMSLKPRHRVSGGCLPVKYESLSTNEFNSWGLRWRKSTSVSEVGVIHRGKGVGPMCLPRDSRSCASPLLLTRSLSNVRSHFEVSSHRKKAVMMTSLDCRRLSARRISLTWEASLSRPSPSTLKTFRRSSKKSFE